VRPIRPLIIFELLGLACAAALAALLARDGEWRPALFLTLLGLSVLGDVQAVDTGSTIRISGSFLALVLAMVLLGGTQAALIGVATILIGWVRWHDKPRDLVNNLLAYAWFPLIGGMAFYAATEVAGLDDGDGFFYLLVLGTFVLALAANFLIIAGHRCYLDRISISEQFRKLVVPVLSSELAAALLAVGIAYLYKSVGLPAIALFGVVLFIFQYLLGQLLVSEKRAEELERRTQRLASLQVGMLSALLRTLDLRDRMTARHSAAVARYSKEIAKAIGCSEDEQELVHTAGLLHDIGKFIFPDRILKGGEKLTDEDWETIKLHPEEGAKIVSQIDGYGPVGEIILAHHERIDGKGYPRGLANDDVPLLSRIISVSDIYDVMTARDSYRTPVSSFDAITELRRVSGSQLDGKLVDAFIRLLAGKDVHYRHGEDADFDAELALDKRVHDYASPVTADGIDPAVLTETIEEEPVVEAGTEAGARLL
jgi:putative nucleotidyltransferase with HDIG domain